MKHLFSFGIFESNYSGDENFTPKSSKRNVFGKASKSLNSITHVSTDNSWWPDYDDELFIGNSEKEENKDAKFIKRGSPTIETTDDFDNNQNDNSVLELDRSLKKEGVEMYIRTVDSYINNYEKRLEANIDALTVKESFNLKLLKEAKQKMTDYLAKLENCPIERLESLLRVKINIYDLIKSIKK